MDRNTAIADLGNSRAKIKICNNVFALSYSNIWILEFQKIISENNISKIYYSSVNSISLLDAKKSLAGKNVTMFDAAKFLDNQNIVDFSEVFGIGNDRKFGLVAATNFSQLPIITIDCGTAITLNLLNISNKALGGMIMPGSLTLARALEHFTSDLPFVEVKIRDFAFGKNTLEAINAGINAAIIGGIKYFIEKIKSDVFLNEFVSVIFTGGYGDLAMQAANIENSQYIKDLVLLGIEKMANFASKKQKNLPK